MSMIAKDNGGINIPPLEAGVYPAIGSMMVDEGVQINTKFGNSSRKFRMFWDIVGETIEINGETFPRRMSKEYSFSLAEKSNLRKDLQAWRGKPFTEEELQGFALVNVLNKGCQLQIINEEKNNKVFNNIAAIMALPKGTKLDELQETTVFDMENPETYKHWGKIPGWIQERIKKAENYEETGLKTFVEENEKEHKKEDSQQDNVEETPEELISEDDLPF